MASKPYRLGFVYVLSNRAMPGLVKIGFTGDLPEDRAKDLYTTGVPTGFKVEFRATTSRYKEVETLVHQFLQSYRYEHRREFFNIDVTDAIKAVQIALIEASRVGSWVSPNPHLLNYSDRLCLTLRAGEIFALIGYTDQDQAVSGRAEVLDLWQAHQDGDSLEIFGASSAAMVSDVNDDFSAGTDDPVPYLNRDGSAHNGEINGLERLGAGERLVWISSPDDLRPAFAVFEAGDACQVISRTWNPSFTPDGFPLMLNHFMHETVWDTASLAMRETVLLPPSRNWAPRWHDPAMVEVGRDVAPPNYWLPQLNPRTRKKLK